MKILITGICGFVGSAIAEGLLERRDGLSIVGIDNLDAPRLGEAIAAGLRKLGVTFIHGDIRSASDFESLAGRGLGDRRGSQSERVGRSGGAVQQPPTIRAQPWRSLVNVLEYCKARRAGYCC